MEWYRETSVDSHKYVICNKYAYYLVLCNIYEHYLVLNFYVSVHQDKFVVLHNINANVGEKLNLAGSF